MARRVASCVADARCRSREAESARRETADKWACVAPQIPSWETVVGAIRARADEQDGEAAQDLSDWADFVRGCAELQRGELLYQKKS